MRPALFLLLTIPLAACGIKGDPEPVPGAAQTNVSISGTASIGVTFRK